MPDDNATTEIPAPRIPTRMPRGMVFLPIEEFESMPPRIHDPASTEAVERMLALLDDVKIEPCFLGLVTTNRADLLDPAVVRRRRTVVENTQLPPADGSHE